MYLHVPSCTFLYLFVPFLYLLPGAQRQSGSRPVPVFTCQRSGHSIKGRSVTIVRAFADLRASPIGATEALTRRKRFSPEFFDDTKTCRAGARSRRLSDSFYSTDLLRGCHTSSRRVPCAIGWGLTFAHGTLRDAAWHPESHPRSICRGAVPRRRVYPH